MLAEEHRQAISEAVERVRGEIVEGLFEEMYRNPFWEARYGERGRRHTRQDTNYHITSLISAIQLNNPDSLTAYYHWVQGLLVYRGMCTLHLEETLDSLGRQLARLMPDQWPMIEPFHRAGYVGLLYEQPNCRALVESRRGIAERTAERMYSGESTGDPQTLERRRNACARDNLYHLSYLADAIAFGEETIYTKYIDWLKEFFPTRNIRMDDVYEDLRILGQEIQAALGAGQAAPFIQIIDEQLGPN